MKRTIIRLAIFNLFALTAFAEDIIDPIDPTKWIWGGNVNTGLTVNTGNTDSKVMTLGADLSLDRGRWENEIKTNGQLTRTDGDTKTQRLTIESNSKYIIHDRLFAFGDLDIFHDKFDTYSWMYIISAGLGYRVLQTDKQQLDVSGGPGYRIKRLTLTPPPNTSRFDNDFIATANADYRLQFTDTSNFRQLLRVFYGKDTTNVRSTSQLNTQLVGRFGLQVSFLVDWQSKIPSDSKRKKKTDTTTKIAITYGFGNK